MYHISSNTYFTTLAVLLAIISSGKKSQNGSTTKSSSKTLLVHALAKQAYALGGLNVEDKIFMPYGFIWLATCTTSILSWILGKSISKPKRAHIYTKRCQSPWFETHGDIISSKLIVQAHGTSSHFLLMIQAHESHQENFRSHGLDGQEVYSVKLQLFKVDKGNMFLGMSSPIP